GGDATAPQRGRDRLAGGPRVLVDQRDENPARDLGTWGEEAVVEQRDQGAGDAEADADAGVRRPAVARERVVAPAARGRLEPLVTGHEDLEDGAGVVLEPAGDAEVGLDRDPVVDRVGTAVDDGGQLAQPRLQQLVLDAERPDPVDEGGVLDADRGQLEAA